MNIAGGFVYSLKDETNTTIHLVPSEKSKIPITPTKYPQGRGNTTLYGPPYSVNLGFPPSSNKLNTRGKIAFTKTLIEKYRRDEIETSDFFGTSEYLIPMLNGGYKSPLLAYTEAHKIVLMEENPLSKVRIMSLKGI